MIGEWAPPHTHFVVPAGAYITIPVIAAEPATIPPQQCLESLPDFPGGRPVLIPSQQTRDATRSGSPQMLSKFKTLLIAGAALPLATGFAFAQTATAPVTNAPAASVV